MALPSLKWKIQPDFAVSQYFYRQSAMRLYYDPTGPEYKYVYGSTAEGTNKLFVIYIGETSLAINPYFFDPARGDVNP